MTAVLISSLYPHEPAVTDLGVAKHHAYFEKYGRFENGAPKVTNIDDEIMVIHGHHRVMAAKLLGMTEIEVTFVSPCSAENLALMRETLEIRMKKKQKGFEKYEYRNVDTTQRIKLGQDELDEHRREKQHVTLTEALLKIQKN